MNRLMVKPMPVRMAAPWNWRHPVSAGRVASPHRTAHHAAAITPICLPANRPSAIPSGNDDRQKQRDRDSSQQAALIDRLRDAMLPRLIAWIMSSTMVVLRCAADINPATFAARRGFRLRARSQT